MLVLGLLTASSVALGARLFQLDASTQEQADAIAEQNELLGSLQSDLGSSRSDLEASQRDLDNARNDLARIAKQVKRLSGQTRRLDSERVDVAAVVADTRAAVVTVHCTDSLGSGFALDIGGVPVGRSAIITNHHVISDCTFRGTQASVSQGDATLSAEVWNWDEVNDLALLYVDGPIPALGAARSFEAGDPVIAVGSPFGLEGTVTTGVISNVYSDSVQTDAAINPGNSGGPLLDRNGQVVGVNTSGLRGDAQNVGFAVRLSGLCQEILTGSCSFS
jgi:S1-C subfamily serine protease